MQSSGMSCLSYYLAPCACPVRAAWHTSLPCHVLFLWCRPARLEAVLALGTNLRQRVFDPGLQGYEVGIAAIHPRVATG